MTKEHTSAAADQNGKSIDYRRKRVNRIKTVIVFLIILCLILPTIFCIILGIQVSKIQKQMDDLLYIHKEYGLTYDEDGSIEYAYAAEKPKDKVSSSEETLLDENTQQTLEDQADPDSSEVIAIDDLVPEDTIQTEEGIAAEEETVFSDSDAADQQNTDGIYAGKKVYLTFDDGPSVYTDEILDILEDYHVKATFFVIGKTDDASKELYQRIVEQGHTLGMHSYSHKYEKIYNSPKDFEKDFTKLWKLLYDTTGYKPSIYRFPGGSDNLVNKNGMENFISFLNDKSIVYFDWNVVSGDATGVKYTKDQLIDNVLGGVAIKNTSIVLLHDSQTKKTTVDSLPGLLKELIAGGAQILPLDKDVSPIQMIKADSVK